MRSCGGLSRPTQAFSQTERELIEDVFEAGDRDLREVMILRTEVAFLDHSMAISAAAQKVIRLPHSAISSSAGLG